MNSEPTRIQYSKFENGELCYVIAELRPGGEWNFWCQETGEVRWHSFIPSPAESRAALALAADPSPGWPRLHFANTA